MTCLIIVGPMRSGTSMVARIAHQMGIQMGMAFIAPVCGTKLDMEYEEAVLASYLMNNSQLEDEWFIKYAIDRQRQATRNMHTHWGLKQPWLAKVLPDLREIYAEMPGGFKIVRTTREWESNEEALLRAMRECGAGKEQTECQVADNRNLRDLYDEQSLKQGFDLTFEFESIRAAPLLHVAEPLAELMGISFFNKEVAVHGIRKHT